MNLLSNLVNLIQIVVGFNLIFPLGLLFIYVCRTKMKRAKGTERLSAKNEADYAIIVTAYGQVDQVPDVLSSLQKMCYSNYRVYVIADHCDASGLIVSDDRIVILRPEVTLASNVKSHFYAIDRFDRLHERLVIIDSDNLVHPELLNELNRYFDRGYQAVQGARLAKNLNTTYACLDAARDIYYHFYDGKLLFGSGSSATLSGSGMAFSVALYRECFQGKSVEGAGFDKVLQSAIVERDLRIAFAEHAIVYDEKTTMSGQLVSQRSRWIDTWFRYFPLGFGLIGRGLTRFSWNQLLFGVVLLRPPLFVFLLISVFFMLVNLFLNPVVSLIWLAGLSAFVAGFILALVLSRADPRIFRSLYNIPGFVFFQLKALWTSVSGNQLSVATRQGNEQDNR